MFVDRFVISRIVDVLFRSSPCSSDEFQTKVFYSVVDIFCPLGNKMEFYKDSVTTMSITVYVIQRRR